MSAASRLDSVALPLPLAREVEASFQRFESAWRAGQRPAIEDHLGGLPAPAWSALLGELLELELSYRRRAGEVVRPEEYRQRFPEHATLIGAIFRQEAGERSQESRVRSQEPGEVTLTPDSCLLTPEPLPPQLGRYRVTSRLGAGAFGVVYKAHDDDLDRDVAIKVPHRHRIATPADVEAFLAEARMLATLDHPGIVPVHDVGRTADGLCYVVSKFVPAQDLRTRIEKARFACAEAADLIAQVAEAVHHANRRGLVHRDIKPANILLDAQGRPVVADFGMALRDADFGTGPQLAGTPAYMSPEQARGEGHRVDARTDVYSLGVVFYELLTGQRPYRSNRPDEILDEIKTQEPRPPRQLDDAIPAELDRICLRALAKRASERYSTAHDLAEDLRDWLAERMKDEGGRMKDESPPSAESPVHPSSFILHPSSFPRVVPKGLRAYDAADADFFLELLPGPRDRHGLPDSLRFWKRRMEETDPDQTFSVGLLYGPSGCGKSSLVKAGLLPRLAGHVRAVYVEATPDETEARMLKGLRKRCPEVPDNFGLIETLTELRRGVARGGWRVAGTATTASPTTHHPLPATHKVVLILDQFEQWLHAKRSEQHTELVQALRQCDGEHVQCLALVRDDFGMAATRFMRDLEVRIVEGHNFATVDLFDTVHARKVLSEFGRAFGRLPANTAELTPEQERFLDQAVAGLAEDGEVVSVRLALFAEMVKGKPWTPATLRQVGGTEGVGVAFLEETFSASTAPPPHRLHQKAARAVLKALLPEPGADLKGHMRSDQELQQAAGYAGRPREFADLLHILDTELRLVTPTELEEVSGGVVSGESSDRPLTTHHSPLTTYYQLTHDYLVPAVRQWLTRKQRETRQGRMELLLAERVSVWSHKQESRQLPGWWEWMNILLWTRPSNRTIPQRQMLRAATRRHLLQAAVLLLIGAFCGWGLWELYQGPVKADHYVESLKTADIERVDQIIDELDPPRRRWADPKLRAILANPSPPKDDQERKERLNASLALLPVERGQVQYLEQRLLEDIGPGEAFVIAKRLDASGHYPVVVEHLRALLESTGVPPGRRFRAACVLGRLDPKPEDWEPWSAEVADGLVKEHPETAVKWALLLRGVRVILNHELRKIVLAPARPESERSLAAVLIVKILAGTNELPRDEQLHFTLETEGKPYEILSPFVVAWGRETAALVRADLDLSSPPDPTMTDRLARRQAHAAVFLLQLEAWDNRRGPLDHSERIVANRLWLLLQESRDPRLHSLRSYLIDRFARAGVKPEVLAKHYADEKDASARRALLLSLGEFKDDQVPTDIREPLLERLHQEYRDDPDPGIHSAVDWLLRQWKHEKTVAETDRRLGTGKVEENRQWYVTRQGHTLAVIARPPPFTMGSPESEPDRQAQETQHLRRIPRSFAIATKEVTVGQFRKFLNAHPEVGPAEKFRLDGQPDDSPVLGVTWFEAAKYCRWLSEKEGIRDEERCYPALPEIKDGMPLSKDYLTRTGYRLPTEAEWEYACRAGAVTSRPYGSADALLDRYAQHDSRGRAARVGSLKPNDLGLFDMLGNAWEWCHDALAPYPAGPADDLERAEPVLAVQPRVLRGGGFFSGAPELRSAHRREWHPQTSFGQAGFRVARTWP